jgi:hypothetical protein
MAHRDEAPTFREFFDSRVNALLEGESALRVGRTDLGDALLMGSLGDLARPQRRHVLSLSRTIGGIITLGAITSTLNPTANAWHTLERGITGGGVAASEEVVDDVMIPNDWAGDLDDQMGEIGQDMLARLLDTMRGAHPSEDLLTSPAARTQFLWPLLARNRMVFHYDPVVEAAIRASAQHPEA